MGHIKHSPRLQSWNLKAVSRFCPGNRTSERERDLELLPDNIFGFVASLFGIKLELMTFFYLSWKKMCWFFCSFCLDIVILTTILYTLRSHRSMRIKKSSSPMRIVCAHSNCCYIIHVCVCCCFIYDSLRVLAAGMQYKH